jgi:indole-3-acetate monooxygenase
VQADYAKSVALLASARLYLEDRIDAAWRGAQASGQLSVTARAQLRLACTHAARTSLEVCRAMMDLGGGSSGFLDNPLQRCLRDAQMMTGHIMVGSPTWELAGRSLFGLENIDPSF